MLRELRNFVQESLRWVRLVITEPRSELTRWQKTARYAYDLCRYGARQLRQDRAPQMAAALSFHTLFGLLPVTVVATVVARAVMGREEFLNAARSLLEGMNLYAIDITRSVEEAAQTETGAVSLGEWLEHIFELAMGLNLAALGWIGLAVVIYTAIALLVTVENSFNTIYRAPEGRSWLRRIPVYWFILTISPLALGLSIFIESQVGSLIVDIPFWGWVLTTLSALWSFVLTWLVMFGVYSLVPNTHVGLRATLIGSLVAAVLLQIGKIGLDAYFANAITFSRLYGSLGLIPLFMFWVYLMWLAVLFGLEVAATIQFLHGRKVEELEDRRPQAVLADPARIIPAMEFIARQFEHGRAVTAREVAEEVRLAEATVKAVLDRLEIESLVHRVGQDEPRYALARPPSKISADQVLEIGFAMADDGAAPPDRGLLNRLREAQRRIAAERTLARLDEG